MPRLPDFIDQTHRITSGDPWYGDAILTVLAGVTHEQAAARPIPNAHSIWELVLHMQSWVREVTRRLQVGRWQEPADGDWPKPPSPSADNWRKAVAELEQAHRGLLAALETFPEQRLGEQLGQERNQALGTGVSYAQMLHGILQHDAYHLGQIGLLRKAQKQ
jgi:uncharacterized damage-inducible protein DinB